MNGTKSDDKDQGRIILNEAGAKQSNGVEYSQEELIDIVEKLAQKYTSYESSSVSYDTARQLLGAVTYCIRIGQQCSTGKEQPVNAGQAYEYGYQWVVERVKQAAKSYNELIQNFDAYDNICYRDTVVKGLVEFFRYYDPKFNPQDHILTLDYPVLIPIESYCGIERIERYLAQILLEQQFLHEFDREFILSCLNEYHDNCQELIINVCEVVVSKMLTQSLLHGQQMDLVRMQIPSLSEEELKLQLSKLLKNLITKALDSEPENTELKKSQYEYLSHLIPDLAFRLKNGLIVH